MKKRFDRKKNALLMIPNRKKDIQWQKKDKIITLIIKRDKFTDNVMHKIFKTPRTIKIELDAIGSFVWENCDGKKNIKDISENMKRNFGDKVDPLIERLISYIRSLKDNKFIELK